MATHAGEHYDVLIVGSGFGGSVAALRLTGKGYRVGVLEAGRRFTADTLPTPSWDLRNFLWAPRLGCYGIQRIHLLRDVLVLASAGVGGGSLNYANTLYRPKSTAFYNDPQWAHITDWHTELTPHYDQAARMLGVTTQPSVTPSDGVMRAVADEYGRGHTVTPTRTRQRTLRRPSRHPWHRYRNQNGRMTTEREARTCPEPGATCGKLAASAPQRGPFRPVT